MDSSTPGLGTKTRILCIRLDKGLLLTLNGVRSIVPNVTSIAVGQEFSLHSRLAVIRHKFATYPLGME